MWAKLAPSPHSEYRISYGTVVGGIREYEKKIQKEKSIALDRESERNVGAKSGRNASR